MNESYIGQIMLFAGNYAPAGWALCNGQLLPIQQNAALFSLIGVTYGGDGQTTFGLPDLRGRAPIHVGQGPGLQNYVWGQKGGVEEVTLSSPEMPAHIHGFGQACSTGAGGEESPANNYLGVQSPGIYASSQNAQMGAGTSSAAGGNQAHENRAPYLAMNYCIALTGIYPSRD
jgi:microcystin-dependent protein